MTPDEHLCDCICGCEIGPAVTDFCAWCEEGDHYRGGLEDSRSLPSPVTPNPTEQR